MLLTTGNPLATGLTQFKLGVEILIKRLRVAGARGVTTKADRGFRAKRQMAQQRELPDL